MSPKPLLGRPPLDPRHPRVVFACRVHPTTLRMIQRESKSRRVSQGCLLDALLASLSPRDVR